MKFSRYTTDKETLERELEDLSYIPLTASFAMNHHMFSAYASSTVVKSPEVAIRGRWQGIDGNFVSQEYLLNFRPDGRALGFQMGVRRFFEPDAVSNSARSYLREDVSEAVVLPRPKRVKTSFGSLVAERRSSRNFVPAPVSLETLSTMLAHGAGVTGHLKPQNPADPGGEIGVRAAASGGGLYPVRLHLLVNRVEGLDPRAYTYQPHSHTLRIGPTIPQFAELCWSPDFDVADASFCIAYEYDVYANSRKYGEAGLAYGLIEVGSISQNLHLARTSFGMAGCDQGGYRKQDLERAVGLDGVIKHIVHFSVFGTQG
jgi:SagB-type dehydrogenase family enzyme